MSQHVTFVSVVNGRIVAETSETGGAIAADAVTAYELLLRGQRGDEMVVLAGDLGDCFIARSPADVRLVDGGGDLICEVRIDDDWHPASLDDDQDHIVVRGMWVRLNPDHLATIQTFLTEHGKDDPIERAVAASLIGSDPLALTTPQAALSAVEDSVSTLPRLEATLRPYQQSAVTWMRRMAAAGLGGILGDEMGLGKTITAIALFCDRLGGDADRRAAVVMPLSLIDNWRREIHRFAPSLTVYVHHGPERVLVPSILAKSDFDVMLTTYDVLVRDLPVLRQLPWDLVVCDEAQNLKNPDTARWSATSRLGARSTFLVTGTPLENRTRDICALASLAVPRVAPDPDGLDTIFEGNPNRLADWLKPILLRRRLADVGLNIPPRIDQTLWLSRTEAETLVYQAVMEELLKRRASPLEVVNRLRMASAHPGLVDESVGLDVASVFRFSSRADELRSRLEESADQGEKSLVFVAWRRLSLVLRDALEKELGIWCRRIDGQTPAADRQDLIDGFSSGPPGAALILSPRAAGVGLNIQAASRVHHLTLDWNPAVESQATGRAHRSGQTRRVHVLRYVYPNTVDALIEERLQMKKDLSEDVVDVHAGRPPTAADVDRLLRSTSYN